MTASPIDTKGDVAEGAMYVVEKTRFHDRTD